MATSDYKILQAQVEFPSTSTPRVFFKLGAAPVGTIGMIVVKPNGATGTPVVMTQLGGASLSQLIYYADITDAYAEGQWQVGCADDNDTTGTLQVAAFQWGGTVDLLCQGAADAALARKALLNQWVPNSATVPTALTLNDDGGGPLLTRTIGNASATPVSPDQVLRLGKAV